MVAAVIGHHRQMHTHAGSGFDMPDAILVLKDIVRIIHRLVAALDHKAHIQRIQVQVGGRITQSKR